MGTERETFHPRRDVSSAEAGWRGAQEAPAGRRTTHHPNYERDRSMATTNKATRAAIRRYNDLVVTAQLQLGVTVAEPILAEAALQLRHGPEDLGDAYTAAAAHIERNL